MDLPKGFAGVSNEDDQGRFVERKERNNRRSSILKMPRSPSRDPLTEFNHDMPAVGARKSLGSKRVSFADTCLCQVTEFVNYSSNEFESQENIPPVSMNTMTQTNVTPRSVKSDAGEDKKRPSFLANVSTVTQYFVDASANMNDTSCLSQNEPQHRHNVTNNDNSDMSLTLVLPTPIDAHQGANLSMAEKSFSKLNFTSELHGLSQESIGVVRVDRSAKETSDFGLLDKSLQYERPLRDEDDWKKDMLLREEEDRDNEDNNDALEISMYFAPQDSSDDTDDLKPQFVVPTHPESKNEGLVNRNPTLDLSVYRPPQNYSDIMEDLMPEFTNPINEVHPIDALFSPDVKVETKNVSGCCSSLSQAPTHPGSPVASSSTICSVDIPQVITRTVLLDSPMALTLVGSGVYHDSVQEYPLNSFSKSNISGPALPSELEHASGNSGHGHQTMHLDESMECESVNLPRSSEMIESPEIPYRDIVVPSVISDRELRRDELQKGQTKETPEIIFTNATETCTPVMYQPPSGANRLDNASNMLSELELQLGLLDCGDAGPVCNGLEECVQDMELESSPLIPCSAQIEFYSCVTVGVNARSIKGCDEPVRVMPAIEAAEPAKPVVLNFESQEVRFEAVPSGTRLFSEISSNIFAVPPPTNLVPNGIPSVPPSTNIVSSELPFVSSGTNQRSVQVSNEILSVPPTAGQYPLSHISNEIPTVPAGTSQKPVQSLNELSPVPCTAVKIALPQVLDVLPFVPHGTNELPGVTPLNTKIKSQNNFPHVEKEHCNLELQMRVPDLMLPPVNTGARPKTRAGLMGRGQPGVNRFTFLNKQGPPKIQVPESSVKCKVKLKVHQVPECSAPEPLVEVTATPLPALILKPPVEHREVPETPCVLKDNKEAGKGLDVENLVKVESSVVRAKPANINLFSMLKAQKYLKSPSRIPVNKRRSVSTPASSAVRKANGQEAAKKAMGNRQRETPYAKGGAQGQSNTENSSRKQNKQDFNRLRVSELQSSTPIKVSPNRDLRTPSPYDGKELGLQVFTTPSQKRSVTRHTCVSASTKRETVKRTITPMSNGRLPPSKKAQRANRVPQATPTRKTCCITAKERNVTPIADSLKPASKRCNMDNTDMSGMLDNERFSLINDFSITSHDHHQSVVGTVNKDPEIVPRSRADPVVQFKSGTIRSSTHKRHLRTLEHPLVATAKHGSPNPSFATVAEPTTNDVSSAGDCHSIVFPTGNTHLHANEKHSVPTAAQPITNDLQSVADCQPTSPPPQPMTSDLYPEGKQTRAVTLLSSVLKVCESQKKLSRCVSMHSDASPVLSSRREELFDGSSPDSDRKDTCGPQKSLRELFEMETPLPPVRQSKEVAMNEADTRNEAEARNCADPKNYTFSASGSRSAFVVRADTDLAEELKERMKSGFVVEDWSYSVQRRPAGQVNFNFGCQHFYLAVTFGDIDPSDPHAGRQMKDIQILNKYKDEDLPQNPAVLKIINCNLKSGFDNFSSSSLLPKLLDSLTDPFFRGRSLLQDLWILRPHMHPYRVPHTVEFHDEGIELKIALLNMHVGVLLYLTFSVKFSTYPFAAVRPNVQPSDAKSEVYRTSLMEAMMEVKTGEMYLWRMFEAATNMLREKEKFVPNNTKEILKSMGY